MAPTSKTGMNRALAFEFFQHFQENSEHRSLARPSPTAEHTEAALIQLHQGVGLLFPGSVFDLWWQLRLFAECIEQEFFPTPPGRGRCVLILRASEQPGGNIVDTACFISCLDLIISPDTMVAHLAGSLRKPVWTVLPFHADWRWMLERDDSPWYPTMRLFRQSIPGEWQLAMHEIYQELHDKLAA